VLAWERLFVRLPIGDLDPKQIRWSDHADNRLSTVFHND
jgi:hypothetical protein